MESVRIALMVHWSQKHGIREGRRHVDFGPAVCVLEVVGMVFAVLCVSSDRGLISDEIISGLHLRLADVPSISYTGYIVSI